MLPHGKVIGGGSSINAQVYQRCSPFEYDEYEKLGNKGWSYKNIIKCKNLTILFFNIKIRLFKNGE